MGAALTTIEFTEEELKAMRAELARREFLEFVRLVRPEYEIAWFHEVVADELQLAGTATKSTRLGLAMPPGHAKSEYALLYCAWMIARDPNITIKYVTYSQEFAQRQFERLKEILTLDLYVEYFGHRINSRRVVTDSNRGTKNSAKEVQIIGGSGWVQACGFGGGITGGRCDIIVIDDPFKSFEEAHSPTTRAKRWNEYVASIKTRKRKNRPLRILMLFTRWHLDDLAGRCKKQEKTRWRWVEFEAIKETEAANDDVELRDPREFGELLWDGMFSIEDLEEARLNSPETFMAMYQQRPIPLGGSLWKLKWCEKRYTDLPQTKGEYIQSWDFRAGGKGTDGKGKGTSYVVGILAFKPEGEARLYVVDVIRERWDPVETLEEFERTQSLPLWKQAVRRYIERKADGISVLAHYGHKFIGMIGLEVHKHKEQRARDTAPFVRAGQWRLPEEAHWLPEYEGEVFVFPSSINDDQMDASTQMLKEEFGLEDETDKPDPARAARARAEARKRRAA